MRCQIPIPTYMIGSRKTVGSREVPNGYRTAKNHWHASGLARVGFDRLGSVGMGCVVLYCLRLS